MEYIISINAVISLIISGLVSFIIQNYIKSKEYKMDFYRLIINKRFIAYERIEVLFKLIMTYYGGAIGRFNKIVYDISENPDSYDALKKQYDSIFEMSMWINDRSGELLARFNDLMVYYKHYIKYSKIDNGHSFFYEYCNKYIDCNYLPIIPEFTELLNTTLDKNIVMNYVNIEANNIACELEKTLIEDYKSFDDVERFLNR